MNDISSESTEKTSSLSLYFLIFPQFSDRAIVAVLLFELKIDISSYAADLNIKLHAS